MIVFYERDDAGVRERARLTHPDQWEGDAGDLPSFVSQRFEQFTGQPWDPEDAASYALIPRLVHGSRLWAAQAGD
jgi:hypothetical protein